MDYFDSDQLPYEPEERRLRLLTHLVYLLKALGFVTLVTPLAGVVVNYVKREDTVGTLYESHFLWQIRTFWWSLLWSALGIVTLIILIGKLILLAVTVWYVYRIIKGWLWLFEGRPMY